MKKSRLFIYGIVFLVSLVFLAGCGKKDTASKDIGQQEGIPAIESLDTGAVENPNAGDYSEGRTSGPMLPIYFAFDSSVISGEQVGRIKTNADYLKENSSVNIVVEGNCDSRGTNEYNLALGERRAQAAKSYLVNLGIEGARISTVSWGEEKPWLLGEDEASMAKNRRDDFVVSN